MCSPSRRSDLRDMYGKKEIHKVADLHGREGARPGDADRGHHLPRLWRADRAHAVRQRLHLACRRASWTSPRTASTSTIPTSTTRSRRSVDDRARGEQQRHLGERQGLEEPERRAEGLGAGGRRRGRRRRSRRKAIALEHKSLAALQKLGVKFVTDVDKASFIKIAEPLQDKLAEGLGPHAVKILQASCALDPVAMPAGA